MKKILYTRDSECLQDLRSLVEKQSHRTLVLWALDCGTFFRDVFAAYLPEDGRPRIALEKSGLWAEGIIKMPEAKKAILQCHDAASENEEHPVIFSSARAVGHAAAAVHVETHALGMVFYGLTAIYHQSKEEEREIQIQNAIKWFTDRLLYWQDQDTSEYEWAKFLQKNPPYNKEYLLHKKMDEKVRLQHE